MLPLILHEAEQGRSDVLMAQSQLILSQVSEQVMHGMQLSVMCSEDAPALKADPQDASTLLGTEFVDFSLAQCAVWPPPAATHPLCAAPGPRYGPTGGFCVSEDGLTDPSGDLHGVLR